jgi:serine O-acetyltransferase
LEELINIRAIKKIWANINIIRTVPAIVAFYASPDKETIQKDLKRWAKVCGIENLNYPAWRYLNYFLVYFPEFRNLFYYRISIHNFILSKVLRIFYSPMETLYIAADQIGPGLFIQHGFGTGIGAKSIGENCWINQQVTIGFSNDTDAPKIGDNVVITSGAKIIGNVIIGNNSIIGANSVVVKNVPENCTVVGNPALIVKKNGVKTKEPL